MDGPMYAICGVLVFVMGGLFFGVYATTSNKHALSIECIKSGGELIQDSCIRNRNGSVSKL